MSDASNETKALIAQLSIAFDDMAMERHAMGAKQYGETNFLGADTIQMALEELVDLANYARYTFIKLAMLGEAAQSLLDKNNIGPSSFSTGGIPE